MSSTQPASEDAPGQPVILVVEDETLIRLDLVETLRECGFHVLEAASADEARIVLNAVPIVDVLFSDINMTTRGDGIELALWVAPRFPDLPVVLASGEAGMRRAAALACGNVRQFLEKPIDKAELEKLVRELTAMPRHARSASA
jgi:DNA-binding NtrC family response regulator